MPAIMRKYDMKDKSIKNIIVRYSTVTHPHEKQKNMRCVLHGDSFSFSASSVSVTLVLYRSVEIPW